MKLPGRGIKADPHRDSHLRILKRCFYEIKEILDETNDLVEIMKRFVKKAMQNAQWVKASDSLQPFIFLRFLFKFHAF